MATKRRTDRRTSTGRNGKAARATPMNQATLQRRTEVGRLYLIGKSMKEIGQILGLATSNVSRHIKAIREEWRERRIDDFNLWKNQELARIDVLEAAAWEAFERSCQESSESRTEREVAHVGEDEVPVKTRYVASQESRYGDTKYLEVILRCIDKRCKILGLDSPIKIAETNSDGTAAPTKMPLAMVRELLAIAAEEKAAKQGHAGSAEPS